MTTSGTTTTEFTVGKIILRGMQQAGYIPTRNTESSREFVEDFAVLSDFLEMEIASLSLEGLFARSVRFYYITLTADEESYDIPESEQRIFGDAVYIPASEANILRPGTETVVQPVTREEYHTALVKDSTSSNPTHYYLDREGPTNTLYVWPVPTEAGTLRCQSHRRLDNVQSANVTPDLQREWAKYLTLTVSAQTCWVKSMDQNRALAFEAKAAALLPKLKAYANQGAVMDAVVVHPTAWSR